MAVWQCRLLLGVVLLHLALSSPSVRRDVLSLTHDADPGPNPLAELQPEQLSEDAFGPTLEKRGGREKRLLKTLGLGALGVKAAKAVGTKVVAAGAKAVGAGVLKTGAAVKAATLGAVGLKAKAIGVKAVTAVAALGIKALIFKLLFGKINQLITHKERLLHQLDEYNRVQNEKFSKQLFGVPPCHHPSGPSYPTVGAAPAVPAAPAVTPETVYTLPNYESGAEAAFSPEPLPQLTKSSLQPRRQQIATSTAAPGEEGEIPEFDPNKISLQVPDELFAPAFNSVNSISTILGNLIQNTAERVATLVERLKPLFRSSLGFRSRKRQTEQTQDDSLETEKDSETTFFSDSGETQQEIQETAGSEIEAQTSDTDQENNLHSPIRSSYAALVNNS